MLNVILIERFLDDKLENCGTFEVQHKNFFTSSENELRGKCIFCRYGKETYHHSYKNKTYYIKIRTDKPTPGQKVYFTYRKCYSV